MPYTISQISERLEKNNKKIRDSVMDIQSFATENSFFNITSLIDIGNELQTMEISALRQKLNTSKEIMDLLHKISKLEENRRAIKRELDILKKRNYIKKEKGTQSLESLSL